MVSSSVAGVAILRPTRSDRRVASSAFRLWRRPLTKNFGHGEMQEADLIGRAAKPADEIGKDAIDARSIRMQLLMPIRGKQQLPGSGGQLGS